MVKLKRIGVMSAGRFGFLLGLIMNVVQLAYALFMLTVIQGVPISVITPEIWRAIFISISINSLIMATTIGLFAFVYNLASGFGGLELEFEMPTTSSGAPKRKNDEDHADIRPDDPVD